jgi:hypothetical protein
VDSTSAPQSLEATGFGEALLELSTQLDTLSQRIDHLSIPQEVKPRQEESASIGIQSQPEAIASFVDDFPIPTLESLPALDKVQPSGKEAASTVIEGPLGELIQRFQERPETQAIKQRESEIEQLTEQLINIALHVSQLKTPQEVNLTGLRQLLAETQGQMDTLYQQFKARPETQAIEQLEGAITQLCEVDLSEDEEAITDFNFQVDAMILCLENLPAPLELDFGAVEQAMANLSSQLNGLGSLKNGATDPSVDPWAGAKTQGIEPLESAIAQLKEELHASISYLENLPDPQGADLWGDEDEIANLQW